MFSDTVPRECLGHICLPGSRVPGWEGTLAADASTLCPPEC